MDVARLLLEKLLPLDLENFLKMTVSVHFVIDGFKLYLEKTFLILTGVFCTVGGILVAPWAGPNIYGVC
jgi:hypothetical protein